MAFARKFTKADTVREESIPDDNISNVGAPMIRNAFITTSLLLVLCFFPSGTAFSKEEALTKDILDNISYPPQYKMKDGFYEFMADYGEKWRAEILSFAISPVYSDNSQEAAVYIESAAIVNGGHYQGELYLVRASEGKIRVFGPKDLGLDEGLRLRSINKGKIIGTHKVHKPDDRPCCPTGTERIVFSYNENGFLRQKPNSLRQAPLTTVQEQKASQPAKELNDISLSMTVLQVVRTKNYNGERKNLLHVTLKGGMIDFIFTMGGGPFTGKGHIEDHGKRIDISVEGKTRAEAPGYLQSVVTITSGSVSSEERSSDNSVFFKPVMIAGTSAS